MAASSRQAENALCSRSRDVKWRERCKECFHSPYWIEADIENALKLSSIMSSSANNVQQKLLLFLQQKSDRIEFVTVELTRPEFNLHRCTRSKQAPSGRWGLAPRLERTPVAPARWSLSDLLECAAGLLLAC